MKSMPVSDVRKISSNMDFLRLKNNITDAIKEEQLKLGYRSETVRLYYPLSSLNRFLDTALRAEEMAEAMALFCDSVADEWGPVESTYRGERFCIKIPPKGVDEIHEHMDDSEFICAFIRLIQNHGCTIEELIDLFHQYSDHVHVEKRDDGEFDWLVYFEDGIPDDYRYCLTDEGCHIIYHRFTPDDYKEFE